MTKRIEELPKICFSDWPGKPKERKSEVQFGHVNLVGLANPEVWKLGYFLTVAEAQEYLRLRDENAALKAALEVFANEKNWGVFMPGGPFHSFYARDLPSEYLDRPFLIARSALGVKLEEKK